MTTKKLNKIEEEVMFVYCRVCQHTFADSLHWEHASDPKSKVGFICPFCETTLWVR